MVEHTRCVVIGGGVLGCAVAYHFARAGVTDVLVLDQADIAQGTTNFGAGLIGQVRPTPARSRLVQRTRQTIEELCQLGLDPDWQAVGSLRISLNAVRDAEFEEHVKAAAAAGVEARFISATEAKQLFPALELAATPVRKIVWCPGDGYVSAPGLARAYAEAARRQGIRFATGTAVLGLCCDAQRRISAVATSTGEVRCDSVVVAAGALAARVAQLVGVNLPIFPVRHQSLATTPLAGFHKKLPVVRIPDARLYLRPYGQAMLIGGFTEKAVAHDPGLVGGPYPQARLDADELDWLLRAARPFLPPLGTAQIAEVRKGLPTCTPDSTMVLGQAPGIGGLYLLAGCHAHGVAASAGLASLLVEAVLQGRQPAEAQAYDPARWSGRPWDENAARRLSEQVMQNYYTPTPPRTYW
jgi:4-methylaminobutanoate oxidase (formaldehyde-forming)